MNISNRNAGIAGVITVGIILAIAYVRNKRAKARLKIVPPPADEPGLIDDPALDELDRRMEEQCVDPVAAQEVSGLGTLAAQEGDASVISIRALDPRQTAEGRYIIAQAVAALRAAGHTNNPEGDLKYFQEPITKQHRYNIAGAAENLAGSCNWKRDDVLAFVELFGMTLIDSTDKTVGFKAERLH